MQLDRVMLDQADGGRARLVVLAGPGGVGKTALALRWLHDNARLFPSGQLHVALGAFGPDGLVTPSTVLTRFLRALGVAPEEIPFELAEQATLFRSLTAESALAILADDAASAAQVRSLLPASTDSLVIATSRWRLGGLAVDGAVVVGLDVLDDTAAFGLLAAAVGQDRMEDQPEQAHELVSLCAGLPVALSVVAARLASRPHWRISRMVEALEDRQRRLDALAVGGEVSVSASFDLSYEELTPAAARLYRLLGGAFPGVDFDHRAAAAVGAVPAEVAEEILTDLVESSLLVESGPDRYGFHDLIRLHAARRFRDEESEQDRSTAVRRLTEWYLDEAISADLVVMPLRHRHSARYVAAGLAPAAYPDPPSALVWLELELPNLLAMQRAAAEHGWHELAWQFCEALWGLFLYRKHYEHWIDAHATGIAAAHTLGDQVAEARLQVQLGTAYLNLQSPEKASAPFTEALRLSRAAGDPRPEATALEHLGLVARTTGNLDGALDNFERALAICEDLHDPRSIVLHTRRIGETLYDLGRLGVGIGYLQRSERGAAEIGDVVLRARALTRLTIAHLDFGDAVAAEASAGAAIEILSAAGSDHYLAEALQARAEVAAHAGDLRRAVQDLRRAHELYERSGSPQTRQIEAQLDSLRESPPIEPD
ncbi:hypothetical protein DL991_10565 [Amycolatopsis sp. WAC 01375]|nr:hypothetical protein DL991_10565 [Amycolatopsis sp. WAC 01375]